MAVMLNGDGRRRPGGLTGEDQQFYYESSFSNPITINEPAAAGAFFLAEALMNLTPISVPLHQRISQWRWVWPPLPISSLETFR